jgi:hypothetical protein
MIRLSKTEIQSICQFFRMFFLQHDKLWLFGSRAKSQAKGGDIDLYIETEYTNADQVLDAKLNFLKALKAKIGEQKIDVLIKFNNFSLPIYKIAKDEGVQLI